MDEHTDHRHTQHSERAPMNVVWGFVIIVAVTAVAVAAMLLVRRTRARGQLLRGRRPRVGRVRRAGDGVLGAARVHRLPRLHELRPVAQRRRAEALIVVQQVETAQFFPRPAAAELTGELVCYARSVVNGEWDRMRDGTHGRRDQPVGRRDVPHAADGRAEDGRASSPPTTSGSIRRRTREEARLDRIHGAVGVIPTPLWIVLFFIAGRDLRVHAVLRRQRRARGRRRAC